MKKIILLSTLSILIIWFTNTTNPVVYLSQLMAITALLSFMSTHPFIIFFCIGFIANELIMGVYENWSLKNLSQMVNIQGISLEIWQYALLLLVFLLMTLISYKNLKDQLKK